MRKLFPLEPNTRNHVPHNDSTIKNPDPAAKATWRRAEDVQLSQVFEVSGAATGPLEGYSIKIYEVSPADSDSSDAIASRISRTPPILRFFSVSPGDDSPRSHSIQ